MRATFGWMRRLALFPVLALTLTVGACGAVGDRIDQVQSGVGQQIEQLQDGVGDLRDQAGRIADRARFCFAVTRTLTSLGGGSTPEEALAAAEEVLAQVPDELRTVAEQVAGTLRAAADAEDASMLDQTSFRDAAGRLRDGTRSLCDPSA